MRQPGATQTIDDFCIITKGGISIRVSYEVITERGKQAAGNLKSA